MRGIDVSSLQGDIDWAAVKADGHDFALIKLTEGTGYVSPNFATQWAGAKANNIIRGAYHFARPDLNHASEEAAYYLNNLPPLEAGDLMAQDLEVGAANLGPWALTWQRHVAQAQGFAPLLYTYPSFVTEHQLDQEAGLAAYPLWFASYQGQEPSAPGPWTVIQIWQHSSTASVAGVAGQVDEDITNLTREQLLALGKPGPKGVSVDDEAFTYYTIRGVSVDRSHAIWTRALLPLYVYWQQHKDDVVGDVPVGDLLKPGVLAVSEVGALWGGSRPAGTVKLSNREVGAYLSTDGNYLPYQVEMF